MKVAKYRCPEGHGDFNLEDPVAHDRWDTTCGHLLLALFDPWAGMETERSASRSGGPTP